MSLDLEAALDRAQGQPVHRGVVGSLAQRSVAQSIELVVMAVGIAEFEPFPGGGRLSRPMYLVPGAYVLVDRPIQVGHVHRWKVIYCGRFLVNKSSEKFYRVGKQQYLIILLLRWL